MNEILKKKINELEKAKEYECWYLVKQATEFDKLCYLVSILDKYKKGNKKDNLETYVSKEIDSILTKKPNLNLSKTHRALRVAAFFGLIKMNGTRYEDAEITETYEEINSLCSSNFEYINKYDNVIARQLEKMYISSEIDEENNGVREQFRLYPVMLLYKVLIEMGKLTGKYSITTNEYRYFVATTKKYEEYLNTLIYIKLLRDDASVNANLEKYRSKFDNRMIQALKQLKTITVDENGIELNLDYLNLVSRKVFIFETNANLFYSDKYIDFLCSKRTLFNLQETRLEEELYYGLNIPKEDEPNDVKNIKKYIDESQRLKGGFNTILYGVPGSGKSWTIDHEYCNESNIVVDRLVFHPDYTYADFVGQILPQTDEETKGIDYVFTAGPFTNILKKAYLNPKVKHILVIEEINRGNAPAIFGEIFQLLDRDADGRGIFGITNQNIAKIVYGDENHKITIPSNLSIIATMNTSDQNVFTLDTAFQRRWNMRLIENDFSKVRNSLADAEILDTKVKWSIFCEQINSIIIENGLKMSSSEDKRLGVNFVREQDIELPKNFKNLNLEEYKNLINKKKEDEGFDLINNSVYKETNDILLQMRKFPEKVIKYLWDDAFKYDRTPLFKDEYKDLEQVVKKFVYSAGIERFSIFKESIVNMFIPQKGNDN